MKLSGDEPANPTDHVITDSFGNVEGIEEKRWSGLTIRQYYSGLAMQAEVGADTSVTTKEIMEYLGLDKDPYDYRVHWHMYLAKRAVAAADALINELNKDK